MTGRTAGRMHFQSTFGCWGNQPGQFNLPAGIAIFRDMVVVSELAGKRVQLLTQRGVPLQVVNFGTSVGGLCADAERVLVAEYSGFQIFSGVVHTLVADSEQ